MRGVEGAPFYLRHLLLECPMHTSLAGLIYGRIPADQGAVVIVEAPAVNGAGHLFPEAADWHTTGAADDAPGVLQLEGVLRMRHGWQSTTGQPSSKLLSVGKALHYAVSILFALAEAPHGRPHVVSSLPGAGHDILVHEKVHARQLLARAIE